MDRVRNWLDLRATLLVAVLFALLSFVTGLANISAVTVTGPIADTLPSRVERTVGFTGTLNGSCRWQARTSCGGATESPGTRR